MLLSDHKFIPEISSGLKRSLNSNVRVYAMKRNKTKLL